MIMRTKEVLFRFWIVAGGSGSRIGGGEQFRPWRAGRCSAEADSAASL